MRVDYYRVALLIISVIKPGNMNINLNTPYVALPKKRLKYINHYGITSESFLIVPLRDFGSDVSCDVRWEDGNGELQVRQHMVFSKENLMKLNGLIDDKLQELWNHYYVGKTTESQDQLKETPDTEDHPVTNEQ